MPECSIKGCDKPIKSRGWCSAHAERFRLHGDPLGSGFSTKRKDKVDRSVIVECAECGIGFNPWQGRAKTSRFCSLKCARPSAMMAITNTDEDFSKYVCKTDYCWVWHGSRTQKGYGVFAIGGKSFRAHRYSYAKNKGEIPRGLIVCHTCDNPPCVNPSHLFLGTYLDNALDKISKNRHSAGPFVHSEAHPLSKLTSEQARLIRSDPRKIKDICATYAVSETLIRGIKNGTHWKYA